MTKTVYITEHHVAMALLREMRKKSGMSQVDLAQRMGKPQSLVSGAETFGRRLDILQINAWVTAVGSTLPKFASELVRRWEAIPAEYRGQEMPAFLAPMAAPQRASREKKRTRL